jgi:NTP pyrophosphatase (non-canonical NTP hydrolase)
MVTTRELMNRIYLEKAESWHDKSDLYRLVGLVEEVGELAESLLKNDYENAKHELAQIGSIAMNWADMWDEENQI